MNAIIRATAARLGRMIIRRGRQFVLFGLMILASSGPAPAATSQAAGPPPAEFRTDRILVRPKEHANLDDLHRSVGTKVRHAFARLGGLQVVDLPAGASVENILRVLRQSGLVQYAEPDYIVHALDTIPNDFRYWDGSLWGLHNTGINGGTPG